MTVSTEAPPPSTPPTQSLTPVSDGQYHLDAAAVCLPGFWRLREKFRTSLDELHINANVPHYERTLKKSMNRFFEKLQPEAPVTRNNVSRCAFPPLVRAMC